MKKKINKIKFLILIFMTAFLVNCNSQTKENSKFLGKEYGEFNLENVTFKENVDTLFSKIDHVNLDRTKNKA